MYKCHIMYKCIIWGNSSRSRKYETTTKSAIKAAAEFGRCEGGEVVEIRSMSGKLLSKCRWIPEDGGKYYRSPDWEIDVINTHEARVSAYNNRSFKP